MNLSKNIIDEIFKHALEAYPEECCGIVTGNEQAQAVHFCENIQNRLHAADPETHQRDARTAYAIDRKEMDKIILLAEKKREKIIAFYHSHAGHDAYFSETDKAAQTVFGEPEFPDAVHIVISVRDRKINGMKRFKWDDGKKDFIEISGRVIPR